MKKYIFLGAGAFTGAIMRYLLSHIEMSNYTGNFPINTLIVNITGTFLMVLIMTIAFEILEVDEDIRLGITTGFMGAYTTFSTMCKETVLLIDVGNYGTAVSYILLSVLLGLLMVILAAIIARKFGKVVLKNKEREVA